jgi:hypothetical protein
MKIKTYYFILAVAAGFFCGAISGQTEPPPSEEKPLLINPPHPAFAGIDKLHVTVLHFGSTQEKDRTFIKQLEANVKTKLRLGGIELDMHTTANILLIPELRIYIYTLRIEDSHLFVFQTKTALARAVCLKEEKNPVFKANIWQTIPVMQAVSEQEISEKVTDLVDEQVDSFINIYKATNPVGVKTQDAGTNEKVSANNLAEQIEEDVNPAADEYSFVASKNSNIFHKPDCRWAGNISQGNLIKYKSREEAIKAGKRPCKTCNP